MTFFLTVKTTKKKRKRNKLSQPILLAGLEITNTLADCSDISGNTNPTIKCKPLILLPVIVPKKTSSFLKREINK